jgi:uncharacterized repeat protein (TIGR03803 family)
MTITKLINFGSSTGWAPLGPLLLASDGNFYGTTSAGGDDGAGCAQGCAGTVFKLTPQGQLTVLHTFVSGGGPAPWANGKTPWGGLVEGPDSWLYGTTYEGGFQFSSYGIVYKISKTGQFQKIHDFCPSSPCPDGANPQGELVWGGDGYFYGTTTAPIIKPYLFRISPSGAYTAVANFFNSPLGTPGGGMLRASDGNLYGVARFGVYRYTPGGSATALYLFGSGAIDGSNGNGPLIEGLDGNLYGANLQGGANGAGTVFRITTSGSFTKIHDLVVATERYYPHGLLQTPDGSLWGTTSNTAPATGGGAVYAITPAGASQDASTLTSATGTTSLASLAQAADGKLYGTASAGGTGGFGTVFVVDAGLPPPVPGEPSMKVTAFDLVSGDVTIAYDPACFATDHHLVYGPLASVSTYAYSGQTCNLGKTGTAAFNPGAGSFFWFLVGNTATLEGSYGRRSGGVERPAASGLPGCAYAQDLSSACR